MSLFDTGELLAPEESPFRITRLSDDGALILGFSSGMVSVHEPPRWTRTLAVRAACLGSVESADLSPSHRFIAIGTYHGVTVLDLHANI